jgi:hypothetical protein
MPSHVTCCPLTVHALLHIAPTIRAMGPVWAYWAFPMEHHCLPSVRGFVIIVHHMSPSATSPPQYRYAAIANLASAPPQFEIWVRCRWIVPTLIALKQRYYPDCRAPRIGSRTISVLRTLRSAAQPLLHRKYVSDYRSLRDRSSCPWDWLHRCVFWLCHSFDSTYTL